MGIGIGIGMEGLAPRLVVGTPLLQIQSWKRPAPPPLPRPPPRVTMLIPTTVGKTRQASLRQRQHILLSHTSCHCFHGNLARISAACSPFWSNSQGNSTTNDNHNYDNFDDDGDELKRKMGRVGGVLVITMAVVIANLQGRFCRPVLAAWPWRSSTTSTTSTDPQLHEEIKREIPEFEPSQEEQINQMFKEIIGPQQDKRSVSSSSSSKGSRRRSAEEEELVKGFRELPEDLQKEVVETCLLAPIAAGDMDKLIGMLDTIIQETSENDVEWRLTKAYVLDDLDKPHEAKAIFQQILQREPSNAHALQGLATVMHKLGEDDFMLKMVEELLQKAIQQKSVEEAYNMKLVLAHVYVVQDNLEEALKQYQHLIDENSKDFRPYLCQGIIYSVLGKKDKAEELFEKYLSFVPDSFSRHDFLNEVMLKVQTEAGKLSEERKKQEKRLTEGKTPEEGKRPERTMEQPKLGGYPRPEQHAPRRTVDLKKTGRLSQLAGDFRKARVIL